MSRRQRVPIELVGLIVALIACVGTFLALPQIQELMRKPTPVVESFEYQVYVQVEGTGEPIPDARVTIQAGEGLSPINELTDSKGLARLFIDSSRTGKSARLVVEATGFKQYVQNTVLIKGALPPLIQLQRESQPKASSTPASTGSPSPGAASPPAPTSPPAPLVIADFNTCTPRTNLGGKTGVTFVRPDSISDEYLKEPGRECSARLVYHLKKNYVAFYLKLAGASLTGYNTLAFDIRADPAIGAPAEVKVELKRSNNAEVSTYYITGVTGEWETLTLPFADFRPIPLSSYTDMSELVFTFELNRAGPDGAVYLDNVGALVR